MKNKNLWVGIILILLGTFWMLENLGFITWSLWEGIFDLWPLILIVIGINMIFKHKAIVSIITWVLFFLALVVYGFLQQQKDHALLQAIAGGNIQIEKREGAEAARLDLDFGGGNLDIGASEAFLVDAHVSNPYVKHRVDFHEGGKKAEVQFKETNHKFIKINESDDYQFGLDESLVWRLDIDMGAVDGTIDLSQLKIDEVDIDAGAGNLELIFGEAIEKADVKIDMGASHIDLTIPEKIGARIRLDSAIKDSNLENLRWNYDQGYYQSPNYQDANQKIDIDIDMGAGSLNVILK